MKLDVLTQDFNYEVIIEKDSLNNIKNLLDLNRKVLVVSDSLVPSIYYQKILDASLMPHLFIIESGDSSKSIENYQEILVYLTKHNFTRTDCIVACGGGVVGDLAGFVAATYMRGITFYNVPTTLLAMVDSSIGGKTAINFLGVKNIVGAFHQPQKVVIDPLTLTSLDKRQLYSGLVEAIKMSITCDCELFDIIEKGRLEEDIETIIYRSLLIKKDIVEKDPKEQSLRKVLNFGHTIGHAIEGVTKELHGFCVASGMLYFVSDEIKNRLLKLYKKFNIPVNINIEKSKLIDYLMLDKKKDGSKITIVKVEKIGSFSLEKIDFDTLLSYI